MDARAVHPGFAKAVEFFGSQADLARALGVTAQYVSQCKEAGFSADSAIALEKITDGAIRAVEVVRDKAAA